MTSSVSFQIPISTLYSPTPHTPDSIRAATLQLSNMHFSASLPPPGTIGMGPLSFRTYGNSSTLTRSETATTTLPLPLQKTGSDSSNKQPDDGGFIFPHAAHTEHEPVTADSTSYLSSQSLNSSFLREIPGSSVESDAGSGLESSIGTLPPLQKLSGLSLLRPSGSSSNSSLNPSFTAPPSPSISSSSSSSASPVIQLRPELSPTFPTLATNNIADTTPTATPMGTPRPLNNMPLPSLLQPQVNSSQNHVHWRSPRSIARLLGPASSSSPTLPQAHEQTPLLGECRNHNDCLHSPSNSTADDQDPEIGCSGGSPTFLHSTKSKLPLISIFSSSSFRSGPFILDIGQVKAKMKREVVVNAPHYLMQAVNAVPAVLLGCLLNILDGVSCELFQSLLI